MKLYELPAEILALEIRLDEEPEADEDLLNQISNLEMEFYSKIEWLAKLVRNEDAEAKKLKTEADFFADKAKAAKNRMERTKMFIKALMEAKGDKKIQGEHLTIAIQKNPPSVDVVDEKVIPASFWIAQDPVLDKKSILGCLKDGSEIPGCTLKQTESLRIR